RGQMAELPSAQEFEEAFAVLFRLSKEVPFKIKTTEAQHYRRFLLQHRPWREGERRENGVYRSIPGLVPINDGKGFVFVSFSGEVFPSGFMRVSAGNIRSESLATIYRESPWLTGLRDSSNLKGKCGECDYREICGGSRARAYSTTGDMFAEEPCCLYEPKTRA